MKQCSHPLVARCANGLVVLSHDISDISLEHLIELLLGVIDRVHLVRVARNSMVHISVFGLVRSDGVNHIENRTRLTKLPVRTGDLGSGLGPPGGKVGTFGRLLDGGDNLGVGMTGLLFDVANETMAEGRAGNVREEEGATKSDLAADHRGTEDGPGLLELDEGKQVHPLIVGLLEEHVEHTAVAFHVAKGGEVSDDGSDHAGNCGNSLKEYGSIQYLFGRNLTSIPTSGGVEH
mmetsp:Transcript_6702/g.18722  ORF Transcript_6702/g.18722 Transcript_6702/m.18722 type:complete len:234 (-) Transcript_6702:680-1381(-)